MIFADLTARKAAAAARRQFQAGILQSHRALLGRLDTQADLAFETIMSTIVENAQLAALEITESQGPAAMPATLESVRNSVARAAEVLEQLSIRPSAPEPKVAFIRAGKP